MRRRLRPSEKDGRRQETPSVSGGEGSVFFGRPLSPNWLRRDPPAGQPGHRADQLGGVDRFGEMGLIAGLQGAQAVLGAGVGGEGGGGDVSSPAGPARPQLVNQVI